MSTLSADLEKVLAVRMSMPIARVRDFQLENLSNLCETSWAFVASVANVVIDSHEIIGTDLCLLCILSGFEKGCT